MWEKLPYEKRFYKTCCKECTKKALIRAGLKVSLIETTQRRSKNEIYFYELCVKNFKNVYHNKPMFNGWDADIIIDDYKIAILWNGPWHYKQVMDNQKSSLNQIQNRDKIKIEEIKKLNYIPYVIKDIKGRYNKKLVENEFNALLNYLKVV